MAEYISRENVKIALLNKGQQTTRYRIGETWELNFMEILEALDTIPAADVQPVNQWISVKDRLPEAVEEDVNGKIAFSKSVLVYLVYDNGFTYITNDICRVDDKSWLHEIPGEGCKVTHWMPLPEPPKDGDKE